MNISKSIVDTATLTKFKGGYPVPSFFSYVAHFINIEDILAVAGILGPDFVEYNDGIYLKEHVCSEQGIHLAEHYGKSLAELEQYNNLFCVSDFFTYGGGDLLEAPGFIDELGRIMKIFWGQRLEQLYPKRCFEFRLEDDLFDEDGLCLTFYQTK
jgi:hypothetical protein